MRKQPRIFKRTSTPKMGTSKYGHLASTLILLVLVTASAHAQPQKMVFERITVQDGLPENSVFSILQDHLGFLWLGTQNGLVKYDGYKMTIYTPDADNPYSMKGRSIRALHEDRSGNVWVGTWQYGLNKFDRATERFTNYRNVPGDSSSLGNNSVVFIHADQLGHVWVVTGDQRVQRLDPRTGVFARYEHDPDNPNSISSNSISAVGFSFFNVAFLEDRNANVWLGTTNGLSRYDHETDSFTQYLPDSLKSGSISGHIIASLLESKSGHLWIGTIGGGLNRYDPESDSFTHFKHNPEDPNSIIGNGVPYLLEDKLGRLWLGTSGGLDRFDPNTGVLTHYSPDPGNASRPSHLGQQPLVVENSGDVWFLSGGGGLELYSQQDGTFSNYRSDPDDPSSLSSNRLRAVLADRSGTLWFGTTNSGLNKLDRSQQKFAHYKKKEGNSNSLSDNRVTAIYESPSEPGILWVGTEDGLNRLDRRTISFVHFKHDSLDEKSLSSNAVADIYEDSSGDMFIATAIGLNRFNRKSGDFERYRSDVNDHATLSDNRVTDILEDHTGTIWVSTRGGLNRFNKETGKFVHYVKFDTTYHRKVFRAIESLIEEDRSLVVILRVADDQDISKSFTIDRDATILIVCLGEATRQIFDYGVIELNDSAIWEMEPNRTQHAGGATKNRIQIALKTLAPGTYTVKYRSDGSHSYNNWNARPPQHPDYWGIQVFRLNQAEADTISAYLDQFEYGRSISDEVIGAIYEDRSGTLWFGTNLGGVFRYNRETDDFTTFRDESRGLVSVWDILEDRSGRLWFADYLGGLLEFDRETGSVTAYTVEDGLPVNTVLAILQDESESLWLGTFNGITKFDPQNGTFTTFDAASGMLGHEFWTAFKDPAGEMFFGGREGLTVFSPEQMQTNTVSPPVALTGFNLFDQPVSAAEDSPLKQHISIAENIELDYNQNDISFEFAALHFSRPEKNEYAYKLENYDSDWRPSGTKRVATYTNLDAGDYIFRVKAANSDGVWNEEGTSVRVTIHPPFWKTWWAYSVYLVLLISTVVTVDRYQRRRVTQRERTKAIVAENERRAKELQEARQLQLSMLPKTVPQLPNIDIAAYMNPATEVGGDYYDFHISSNGTLTVAVGDATGHGLNAGMMVTAAKSLFESLAGEDEVLKIVNQSNRVLKQMNLRTLNMAMTILKIKDSRLTACGAGMPPLLVFREASNEVEEVVLTGMPLGSLENFPYREKEISFSSGDMLLLMSDGFPERFNDRDEMLNYEKAYDSFKQVAKKSPQEAVDFLVKTGNDWGNGRPQDDDVTFVVIKRR